jgi:fermentation-respiration switch protein FrsA (DUF1100 family)
VLIKTLMESYLHLKNKNRRHRLRLVLLTLSLLILIGGALGFLGLRWFEGAVTFHPARYQPGEVWKLPPGGEDVWFKAASGERLHGWFVRASGGTPEATAPTVIYFHGNGGNLSNVGWLAEALSARGVNVLLFDYRGYGRSEGRVTDEHGIYADADAAYDYLVKERGVSHQRIALYGQSLGTTAAVDLASRKGCAGGLILESGLSSASDMAAEVLPFLPRFLHALTRNRFDSARKLQGVSCPVLIAHGALDSTIPVEQAGKLYNAAPEPKRLIILPDAGHNDVVARGGPDYLDTVARFIQDSINSRT